MDSSVANDFYALGFFYPLPFIGIITVIPLIKNRAREDACRGEVRTWPALSVGCLTQPGRNSTEESVRKLCLLRVAEIAKGPAPQTDQRRERAENRVDFRHRNPFGDNAGQRGA